MMMIIDLSFILYFKATGILLLTDLVKNIKLIIQKEIANFLMEQKKPASQASYGSRFYDYMSGNSAN